MEDSTTMTVDFLRARLLSERSVSRTARQRADELAKRVVELEQQLKIITLQRKKAEEATTNILAILENHGISDVSEEFDSSSDQEATFCETKAGKEEETLDNPKVRKNDIEIFSGSEHESSPVTGRSLSWKSDKDSSNSLEKKKYMDPTRTRCSGFANTGSSSPKRVGKSCRQIRRRETRSDVQELQNDIALHGDGVTTCLEQYSSASNVGPETSREGSENNEVFENQRVTRYFNGNGGEKDMESALELQAELIGQYEAEEEAQREWEEKFKENNSCTMDSCDVGNHSDVTEERDDNKAPAPSCSAGTIVSQNQEAKVERIDFSSTKEFKTSNSFQPPPNVDSGSLNDQKCGSMIGNESTTSGSRNELALIPHESSDNLVSVLAALEQAKLSLKQKLDRSPLIERGSVQKVIEPSVSSTRADERLEIPVECARLFRLPTDFQHESTTQTNFLVSCSRISPSETVGDRFFSGPYIDPRSSASPNDRFLTIPARPYTEMRQGVPTWRTVVEPSLDAGLPFSNRYTYPDFHSPSKYTYPSYPFYPEIMPRIPSNELSRPISSGQIGVPPTTHFSFYDNNHFRPNM